MSDAFSPPAELLLIEEAPGLFSGSFDRSV